tara:strand:+ start:6643 stop:7392 length:750 start_codon:yes stop_codon:yes gene_type:complete
VGTTVFKDAKIFLKGFDLSGDHNDLGLNFSSEMLDATTFGNSTRIRKGGLKTADMSGSGFWQGGANEVDDALFNRIGVDNELMTLFGDGINGGTTCAPGYAMKSVAASYNPGGSVGALLPFTMTAMSESELVRAIPLQNATETALSTGATNSTPVEVGAIESGMKLYAGQHGVEFATSTTGARLDMAVQNASSSGASYNTVLNFTQLTAIGGEWGTPVTGPSSTDRTWWRIQSCSCGASVKALGWVGIQ